MPTCHDPADARPSAATTFTVALAGNPNSGKTTIFNALTGLRQKTGNYPGVTVERKTGRCRLPDGTDATVIDLPGTYSLVSRSPDEVVAADVLRGLRPGTPTPDAVCVVVDASNLQRNLYLVSQLIELGRPLVVALNMTDVAERRGVSVSADQLSTALGVEVIPIVGHKRRGVQELKTALRRAAVAPPPDWPLPPQMKAEIRQLADVLAGHARPAILAERLLIGDRSDDVVRLSHSDAVRGHLPAALDRLRSADVDPMQADIEAHYRWIDAVASAANSAAPLAARPVPPADAPLDYVPARTVHLTEQVDRILVHKVWGLLIFAVIMAALFVSIFWLAAPIMDGLKAAIDWLGQLTTRHLPDGPIKDLLTQGIFAGVGSVVVFVPQIALLFFFLAILEDSGYLARAAFLMDRLLSKVGLHGKSFIPLLSSFACAIPGVMAARTIENRKDRLATILVAPFMSCSARLPVYTLLIGTFFARWGAIGQAGVMLACYVLGILAAVGTALVFKRTLLRSSPPSSFILEMPTYKVPQARVVARQVWTNARQFLTKAGTTIFALSVLLWALAYYPRLPTARSDAVNAAAVAEFKPDDSALKGDELAAKQKEAGDDAVAAAQSEYSLAGRFGHAIEPVIRPLGYDWKIGVGLVGAFAAREVFVSTEGIIYAAGNTDEAGTGSLSKAMTDARHPDGRPVWTPLVAASLLIWFVLAMQCMSTVAVVRRETNGWGWPLFMLAYMNVLAYVICLIVYQVGTRLT